MSLADGLELIPTPVLVRRFAANAQTPLGTLGVLAPTRLLSHILALLSPPFQSSYADCLFLFYEHQVRSNLKLCTPALLCVGGSSCICFLWPSPTHLSGLSFKVTFAEKSSMTRRLYPGPPCYALSQALCSPFTELSTFAPK